MNDFNIEFAHIYADQEFGKEQVNSISKLKIIEKELEENKKSFVAGVLIDDYSPIVCTLDENDFLEKIKKSGVSPDFIAHESELSGIADSVISSIPENLLETQKFQDKEVLLLIKDGKRIGLKDGSGKHTCSVLIAAWTLVRFGRYELDSMKKFSSKEFKANQLITILPTKYEETEQKVIDILEVTKYQDLIKNIRYEFF